MYHVMFPPAFIALQAEIINHPELQRRLQKHHDTDGELQFAKCIAEVAAYVNVALDGIYEEDELIKIADICVQRLRDKRVAIIVTSSGDIS